MLVELLSLEEIAKRLNDWAVLDVQYRTLIPYHKIRCFKQYWNTRPVSISYDTVFRLSCFLRLMDNEINREEYNRMILSITVDYVYGGDDRKKFGRGKKKKVREVLHVSR